MDKRENNYDLLRTISAIAVILIHVSETYLWGMSINETLNAAYQDDLLVIYLYNVLSRFAVPCFIMLSGAFILSNEKNADFGYFYRKTFIKIGIPTIIFSGLYFAFSMLQQILKVCTQEAAIDSLLIPVKNLISGAPYVHMWYLYMMIGVYILAPVLILLKKWIGEKNFRKVTWVFLVCASIGASTSSNELSWDIGFSFRFLGYFMAGYELREAFHRKDNARGLALIAAGLAVESVTAWVRYSYTCGSSLCDLSVDPLAPLIVVASLCIFAGFSCLDIKWNSGKLSAHTFFIYLFHAGVWSVLSKVARVTEVEQKITLAIPLFAAALFLVSLILSKLYQRIWSRIDERWDIQKSFLKCSSSETK